MSRDLYVGLMSGTSLDGVDVAIVDFADPPLRLLHAETSPYPASLRARLGELCQSQSTSVAALFQLDAELGEHYAGVVKLALERAALEPDAIAALGCHGQTIAHGPEAAIPFSAQLGDPNRLAALTGITTVADFRRKDIALGGQAAPLAPAFHRYLFRSDDEDRVVVNIGGIANLTWLPRDASRAVIGFDTGPGSTLCDYWIGRHLGKNFDADGDWARGGQVIEALLARMLDQEPYFAAAPPKSTGTEYFGRAWLEAWLDREYDARDLQATLVELTVATVAAALLRLPAPPSACYLCGGGAHNAYLVERLRRRLPGCDIATTARLGLDPDFVEAAAFAWLARERIHLRSGSIPEVTHARRASVLGGVYAPD